MNSNKKTLFLSYPRSGNSMVMYFIKRSMELSFISDCYFSSAKAKKIPITKENINKVSKKCNNIFKEHYAEYCNYFNSSDDNLIFIIRNYKECIPRHCEPHIKNLNKMELECKKYMKNVKFYNEWIGPKKILYYEDLITKFKLHYSTILDIVNVNMKLHNKLFDNFEYHKNECLNHYNKICGSHSKGKAALFHSKKLSPQTINIMDKCVKSYSYEDKQIIKRYF